MKITLVLGAGASFPFGYPLGATLRQNILGLPRTNGDAFRQNTGLRLEDIQEFVSTFAMSEMYSIDAFLARRPEFSDVGRICIAALLLQAEQHSHLTSDLNEHWLRYFFNEITTDRWEDLDFSNLSIVTFNYDRLVEHYLLSALQHAYGRSQVEALEKLRTLDIKHVYGTLGPTLPDEEGYLGYGQALSPLGVQRAASSLKVIPEGREEDAGLVAARALLTHADRIAFLGFSFDRTNIQRLRSSETCRTILRTEGQAARRRKIVASCYGMTEAEAREAIASTKRHKSQEAGDGGPYHYGFWPKSCLDTLRETLILRP